MTQVPSVNDSVTVSELSVQETEATTRKETRKLRRNSTNRTEEHKSLDSSLNVSNIESKESNDAFLAEMIVEEPLKPRCMLLPNEVRRFRIRFEPEETMHYQETYALTILDGNNATYEVNVNGIADVPRLELNVDPTSTNVLATLN